MQNDTPLYQLDPTNRFTHRTQDYDAYRPTYPSAAIDAILEDITPQTVADIGAGTGISSRLLADRNLKVWAVEPNAAMRATGSKQPNITAWEGTAEQTGLADNSMDLVTSFQAFHWFKHNDALPELQRILKPNGRLAVVWNNRDRTDEFTKRYGQVLQSVSSKPVGLGRLSDATPIRQTNPYFTNLREISIPHQQALTLEALIGLANSRSYTPQQGAAKDLLHHRLAELHRAFANNAGIAYLQYQANIFLADPA
ncbi:class I SAM-dependent methyltransferase [filamentous cyanobacterium LEGE 11480]|uniref:Class I SAM-dependent methyltransferase n=1 Tax=Romeriopsis navalis LEGE 11480 TaxID=2777977 RepID=A0A928Z554_9CYAN|nr:class I SAM-dependent methyltransferase [Romeriopsis navalis]MBE9033301.1 class I SAM-dependent methyltransferase [Romeriopsis navalis LEGE 11480]